MRAEQDASCRFSVVESGPVYEVHIAVTVEVPGEAGVDATAHLAYEPKLPEPFWDPLHQALYDGIYGGIALVERPLPSDGMIVTISALRIDPSVEAWVGAASLERLAALLRTLASGTVATLWLGLGALRPGP